jgi:hypothetical protein
MNCNSESPTPVLTRRNFLQWMLYGAGCLALVAAHTPKALASDDDSGSDDGGDDDGNDGGDDDYAPDDSDQDDALKARRSGDASPTGELIAILKKKMRGEIIDIRLVNQNPPAYDIKMINAEGRIGTVRVVAKTFKILRMTGF